MASLMIRGVGLLARSLAGLSFTQSTRCSRLPGVVSLMQCTASRCFSKGFSSDDLIAPSPAEIPKYPLTSFFRFARERRPLLFKQHPGSPVTEVMSLIGAEWRQLSETEKQVYRDDAKKDFLKYKECMKNLNPLVKEAIKEKKKAKKHKMKVIKLKREKTLLGKPKRRRSPFNIFMSEHFHEAKAESTGEKLIYLRHQWDHLPDTKKQVYIHLSQDDKVRYANELKAWEEQMIEIGRIDILGHKRKIRLSKKSEDKKSSVLAKKSPKVL